MPRHAVLTAVGRDRPGIVAAVTRVLFDSGCNLEDSSMTLLGGEFAVLLIVQIPEGESVESLQQAFAPVEARMGLAIHLKEISEGDVEGAAARGEPHVISVYGADRPGIVYRVADVLAREGVNVTDVMTHRTRELPGGPLYQLILEVEVPPEANGAKLDDRLQALGRELGVEVSCRALEAVEL